MVWSWKLINLTAAQSVLLDTQRSSSFAVWPFGLEGPLQGQSLQCQCLKLSHLSTTPDPHTHCQKGKQRGQKAAGSVSGVICRWAPTPLLINNSTGEHKAMTHGLRPLYSVPLPHGEWMHMKFTGRASNFLTGSLPSMAKSCRSS